MRLSGQAEIKYFYRSPAGYEEIRRFNVAMHNASRMSFVEGIGNLDRPLKDLLDGGRLGLQNMPESFPLEQFHGNEGLAFMLANLVDSADIRVIQRRRSTGFPLKAIERLLVFQRIWREKLQGDEATEGCVLGLVNDTHAAAAEFLQNAVVANGAADHLGKRPVGENVRCFAVARQRLSKTTLT